MQRVHDMVHTLRQKPEHVRQNIAVGVSGGVTLVVALAWLVTSVASGTFSISPTKFTSDTSDASQAVATSKNSFSELLGAAGAAVGAAPGSPASITVVDTKVHSTLEETSPQADRNVTVIHF